MYGMHDAEWPNPEASLELPPISRLGGHGPMITLVRLAETTLGERFFTNGPLPSGQPKQGRTGLHADGDDRFKGLAPNRNSKHLH